MKNIRIKEYEQAPGNVSIGGIKWKKKWDVCITCNSIEEAEALKTRLAQPEPEPVAVIIGTSDHEGRVRWCQPQRIELDTPLYTAPPQREPVSNTYQLPEPEPVAWIVWNSEGDDEFVNNPSALKGRHHRGCDPTPVYTAPPQREWQGLTSEEVVERANAEYDPTNFVRGVAWAIEKLKEKNT